MTEATIRNHAAFIWSVADLLRGDYKQSEYGKVILPLTVIRRLDCVLEPTKEAVLKRYEKLKGRVENIEPVLCSVSGEQFFNASPLDFRRLLDDPAQIAGNLRGYIAAFSSGAREVIDKFSFDVQIARLDKAEDFHERLRDALLTLGAKADPCAIPHAAILMRTYPAETAVVVAYLSSVIEVDRAAVIAQIEEFLLTTEFCYAWQTAWALRLLLDQPSEVPIKVTDEAARIVGDRASAPLAVVAALELLADVGQVDPDLLQFMWRSAPVALRPDLVAAAVRAARQGADWADAFLEGCSGDRVNEVVMAHLGHQADS